MFASVGSGMVKPDSQPPMSGCQLRLIASATATPATAARAAGLRHRAAGRQPAIAGLFRDRHRSAHRAIVLPIAIDPVRHAIVDVHVIHLPVRQGHANRTLFGIDAGARVIGEHVSRRVLRIDPDVVAVAAARLSLKRIHAAVPAERRTPVGGSMKAAARNEHVVGVLWVHHQLDVIPGAANERPVPAHDLPRRASVVGSPYRSLICRLDQRIRTLTI